jgi:hypothetical protein
MVDDSRSELAALSATVMTLKLCVSCVMSASCWVVLLLVPAVAAGTKEQKVWHTDYVLRVCVDGCQAHLQWL